MSAHAVRRATPLRRPVSEFQVLHVCVGNLCRSVLAERLMRHGIATRLGAQADCFAVTSAGTRARVGLPMHPDVSALLAERGVAVAGFRTRCLEPDMAASADLVLAATAVERDAVVALAPGALRTTFTLKEFARLARHVRVPGPVGGPVEWARRVVDGALALRGQLGYVGPGGDDLADPTEGRYGFADCADEVAAALNAVLDRLCATALAPGA